MTHTADEVRSMITFMEGVDKYFAKQISKATEDLAHWAMRQNSANASEVTTMLRAYADLLDKPKLTREGLAKTLFENQSNGASWYDITDIARGYWYGAADALIAAGVEVREG